MIKKLNRNQIRLGRHYRIRNKISGTAERPRMCVYRSINQIYVQLIDDVAGNTLAAASSVDKDMVSALADKTKCEASKLVGEKAAKIALEKGIKEAVFDRGGYLYTGRVAALADGARAAGLKL